MLLDESGGVFSAGLTPHDPGCQVPTVASTYFQGRRIHGSAWVKQDVVATLIVQPIDHVLQLLAVPAQKFLCILQKPSSAVGMESVRFIP